MTSILRRLGAAIGAVLLAITLLAAPAMADNSTASNEAVSVNTKDGGSVFHLAFSVVEITDDTVAPSNAAVAYASCTDCQTVAIAIQIVFVVGSPSTFTPTNLAVAINENCNGCDTLASAYQFVVQSPVRTTLTGEGRQKIADIRTRLEALKDAGLSSFELQAKIAALMDELKQVLATEVVPVPGQEVKLSEQKDEHNATTTTTADSVGATDTSTTAPDATTTSTAPDTTSSTAAP